MAEMPFAEHNNMVKTLPSDRTDEPLRISVLPWRPWRDTRHDYAAPGAAGYIESFNARLRDELLNGEIFFSPTLDPLVVDDPTRLAQQFGDLAIAIAAVLPGKLDNIRCETLLIVTTARDLALCRAMLPERRTGATLGDMQLRSHLLDAGTATRGA